MPPFIWSLHVSSSFFEGDVLQNLRDEERFDFEIAWIDRGLRYRTRAKLSFSSPIYFHWQKILNKNWVTRRLLGTIAIFRDITHEEEDESQNASTREHSITQNSEKRIRRPSDDSETRDTQVKSRNIDLLSIQIKVMTRIQTAEMSLNHSAFVAVSVETISFINSYLYSSFNLNRFPLTLMSGTIARE